MIFRATKQSEQSLNIDVRKLMDGNFKHPKARFVFHAEKIF
jgi:hypothetical protein